VQTGQTANASSAKTKKEINKIVIIFLTIYFN